MKIPKEVREAVIEMDRERARNIGLKLAAARPKCWKKFGEMSRNHAHDSNGNCVLKNWSNDEVELRK